MRWTRSVGNMRDARLFVITFVSIIVVAAVKAKDEHESLQCEECGPTRVCTGGEAKLTLGDLQCIVEKSRELKGKCDQSYRNDTCGECRNDARQYKTGSRLMDCNGKCFKEDTIDQMMTIDKCGVCGGNGDTCDSTNNQQNDGEESQSDFKDSSLAKTDEVGVLVVQPMLIPQNTDTDVTLKGVGFSKSEHLVIVLKQRLKREEKKITIGVIDSPFKMTVKLPGLEKGIYEVIAKLDEKYQYVDGPNLRVYGQDVEITKMIPKEGDLVRGRQKYLNCSIYVKTSLDLSTSDMKLTAIIGNRRINATYSRQHGAVRFKMPLPHTPQILDICLSLNGQHIVGCRPFTFYTSAPNVTNNEITFTPDADQLVVRFTTQIVPRQSTKCSDYFMTHRKLGAGATCKLIRENTALMVNLTRNATVLPGSQLELSPGLKRVSEFQRESKIIIVKVTANNIRPIKVEKFGSWPTSLSLYSKNPLKLRLAMVFAPGGRAPKSITWWVNDRAVAEARNKMNISINVLVPRRYLVRVEVTDVFGGRMELKHEFNKTKKMVPGIDITPMSLHKTHEGRYLAHPSKRFSLRATIDYATGNKLRPLVSFAGRWTMDNVTVGSSFQYDASNTTIKLKHCNKTVVFGFRIYLKKNEREYEERFLKVDVQCRKPVVRIVGAKVVPIPVSTEITVVINGKTGSYDPDGGVVSYKWQCHVQGQTSRQDCIRGYGLMAQSHTPMLKFSNRLFKVAVGKQHIFTLTMTVQKGNRTYTISASVTYIPTKEHQPYIQFVSPRIDKFRRNQPVIVKAKVGHRVGVKWEFRRGNGLVWANASSTKIVRLQRIKGAYALLFIRANVLIPGAKYMLQIRATNKTRPNSMVTSSLNFSIYEALTECEIMAKDITELEETMVEITNCHKDESATEISATCRVFGKKIPLQDGKLMVPMAEKRGIKTTKIGCWIKDNLAHGMWVVSKAVGVTQVADKELKNKFTEKIAEFTEKDDAVNAVRTISQLMAVEDKANRTQNTKKLMVFMRKALSKRVTTDEAENLLNAYLEVKPEEIKEVGDAREMAETYLTTLTKLCRTEKDDNVANMSRETVTDVINKTRELVKKLNKKDRKLYRSIKKMINCIESKQMNAGEVIETTLEVDEEERKRKMKRVVQKIENVDALNENNITGGNVTFPTTIGDELRNSGACSEDEGTCDDIAVVVDTEERSVDLPQGKEDDGCQIVVSVDLVTGKGESMKVKDLSVPIEINLGSSCKQAACYYFDENAGKFATTGVTTAKGKLGETICKSTHLTSFTVQSEESPGEGQFNFPMAIGLTFGCVLLTLSSVVLVRGYLKAKAQHSKDEKKCTVEYMQSDLTE